MTRQRESPINEFYKELLSIESPTEKINYIKSELDMVRVKFYQVYDPTFENGVITIRPTDFEYVHIHGYESYEEGGGSDPGSDRIQLKKNPGIGVSGGLPMSGGPSQEELVNAVKKVWKLPPEFVEDVQYLRCLLNNLGSVQMEVGTLKDLEAALKNLEEP